MTNQSPFAFIVGAPRCGTTTLAGFLQQHPEVCFSAVKEPHFFSRDELDGLSEEQLDRLVRDEYLDRFFGQCSGTEKLRAEGSVTYLYTPERMRRLKRGPTRSLSRAARPAAWSRAPPALLVTAN